jgi:hypothetical protein
VLVSVLAAACASPAKTPSNEVAGEVPAARTAPAPVLEEPPPAAPAPPEWTLPAAWNTASDLAFERALDGWLPPGSACRLSPNDLARLSAALDGADATAVRAAVLLARTRDPRGGEALLARLERRVPGSADADAVDVVAACAFAEGTPATNASARLAELAAGKRPHPDLCARVECARSALALGRDGVIGYLLQVLRTATKAGKPLGPDDSPADLAFAQTRAAEALAARAGTDVRFRPEASVKDREAEAARLEKLLPGLPKKR